MAAAWLPILACSLALAVLDSSHLEYASVTPSVPAEVFLKNFLTANSDPDCTRREFDLRHGSLGVAEGRALIQDAYRAFKKCRLVVLRRVLRPSDARKLQDDFLKYIADSAGGGGVAPGAGKTHPLAECRTSWGESYCMHDIGQQDRWEFILPASWGFRSRATRGLMGPFIKSLLKASLGPGFVVHSLGAVVSAPSAEAGHWHLDQGHLFEQGEAESKLFGHQVPPFAITLMSPIINISARHGPTEFCTGSSHIAGFTNQELGDALAGSTDLDIVSRLEPVVTHLRTGRSLDSSCPREFIRAPELQLGDVLLFDYSVYHRGGANESPDPRPILYYTLSKPWFHDNNFADTQYGGDAWEWEDHVMAGARFAREARGLDPALAERRKAAQSEARSQMDIFFEKMVWGGRIESLERALSAHQANGGADACSVDDSGRPSSDP